MAIRGASKGFDKLAKFLRSAYDSICFVEFPCFRLGFSPISLLFSFSDSQGCVRWLEKRLEKTIPLLCLERILAREMLNTAESAGKLVAAI